MILDEIVADKKIRLAEQKKKIPLGDMRRMSEECEYQNHGFYEALKKDGISIIGEYKKASPSLGKIEQVIPLSERINDYNEACDAVSCLTEEDHFSGSTQIFSEMRRDIKLPMIRKDRCGRSAPYRSDT